MNSELDRERIGRMTFVMLIAIQENYGAGTVSRARAYEALNALAASAATVILGCDGLGGEAEEWFMRALKQNLNDGASDRDLPSGND
jgi:hypothetical protein